ncbi:MAG: GntR family transcriptional regulator [Paenibacillaceae bacterium]
MLDEKSGVPLYVQIINILREKMESGEWPSGHKIPSEPELQSEYNVSRFTVRQSISSLMLDGLVTKTRGKGTFVSYPKIKEDLPDLISFSEEMKKLGKVPSTAVQSVEIIIPPKLIRDLLKLDENEKVLRIERLRSADNIPITLLVSYLPMRLGLDPGEDFSQSLFDLLINKYKFEITRGDQEIEAIAANSKLAHLLEIPRNSPLLVIRRITFDHDSRPVEYVEGFYPGGRYSYKIVLSRNTIDPSF